MTTYDIMYQLVLPLAAQFIFDFAIIAYTLFFAIHAAQHVADPTDRAIWLVLILVSNILGATCYLFTKYRKFKAVGKGRLIIVERTPKPTIKEFLSLTAAEKI